MRVANYCPTCGTATVSVEKKGVTRPYCPSCDLTIYFDPKVSAIAFIREGERALLVKRGMSPGKGKWALAGGFVDAGEDPQATVIRELREETGVEIAVDGLLVVFHTDGVIAIAYSARITGGIVRAGDDADEVRWFAKDDLPELVFDSTITLMERWRSGILPSF
jgi:ADP-ribose pyrophosphatase YjhB (NUDIX family)